MDPTAVLTCYDALCAKDKAVLPGIQLPKGCFDILRGELLCRLHAPGGEHLVGMVMMVLMIVIVTAAAVAVLMVMVMLVLVLMVMVLVLMVMTAAAVTILMMVVVLMVVILVMMLVLMILVVAAAAVVVLVVMVVMLLLQLCKLSRQGRIALHCINDLITGKLVPGCGDDGSIAVMLP